MRRLLADHEESVRQAIDINRLQFRSDSEESEASRHQTLPQGRDALICSWCGETLDSTFNKNTKKTEQSRLRIFYRNTEYLQDSLPKNGKLVKVRDNDSVIFMNFRADRARELSYAVVNRTFDHFPRSKYLNINFKNEHFFDYHY